MGNKISIRFYEELNDFLPERKKRTTYPLEISYHRSVKDIIEAEGIPHTEVDLILVNNEPVAFDYKPGTNDRIAVYPVFESLDITSVNRLRPEPLRVTRFILDVHLGKLARYLRMLGFDCVYENDLEDPEIVERSLKERRIILTRDIQLLKNGKVTHGYFMRSTDPKEQLKEVFNRFDLRDQQKPFTICMNCNGLLVRVEKGKIQHLLEKCTRENFDTFFRCMDCKKIYWPGSHFEKMSEIIESL